MKRVAKRQQILTFQSNSKITFILECVICGDTFEKDEDCYDDESLPQVSKEHAEAAYKAGWRESNSKVFGHLGIHCPECHKHRNKAKHFDD